MTFTEDRCLPLLLTVVALSGVSLGGWLDTEPNKQAVREVDMWAGKHKSEEKNTVKHGCRASHKRIPKHARRVDRRQPVRYADKQRSLSAVRQILLPDQRTDS